MAAQKTDIKINLRMKPREAISGIFFKWAIQVGRIVIVVTELILLSSLIYRFVVDRNIIDLHENIQKQVTYISQQEQDELLYRDIQSRLEGIKSVITNEEIKLNVYNFIHEATDNEKFVIKQIRLGSASVMLQGEAATIYAVNDLMQEARNKENISSIILEQITNSENKISFVLVVDIKIDPSTQLGITTTKQ